MSTPAITADYVFKKDAASKVKTDDAATTIIYPNEKYYTQPYIRSENVWLDSTGLLKHEFV